MLKTYAIGNSFNNSVNITELDEEAVLGMEHVFEITTEQSKLAPRYILKDGELVDNFPGKTDEEVLASFNVVAVVVDDLEVVKQEKIQTIRGYFNGIIEMLKKDVATYEVATWDTQRIEYTAWLGNKATPTPYVDSLAAGRGIDRDMLMGKIGTKVAGMAMLQGQQQALEVQVSLCTTVEEVNAVTVSVG